MLNQMFTNKIGLRKSTNITKNIYYENIKKSKYLNWNTSVYPLNEINTFLDAEFEKLFNVIHIL